MFALAKNSTLQLLAALTRTAQAHEVWLRQASKERIKTPRELVQPSPKIS